MSTLKIGRNDVCPCGSGKKYKQCCEGKETGKANSRTKWAAIIIGSLMLIGALSLISAWSTTDPVAVQPRKVWSAEHGHYH